MMGMSCVLRVFKSVAVERRSCAPPSLIFAAALALVSVGLTQTPEVARGILLALPQILSAVFGGRDASWLQVAYVAPALVGWLAVATVVGLAVIVARERQLRRGEP
jgi:hypothetical protein